MISGPDEKKPFSQGEQPQRHQVMSIGSKLDVSDVANPRMFFAVSGYCPANSPSQNGRVGGQCLIHISRTRQHWGLRPLPYGR